MAQIGADMFRPLICGHLRNLRFYTLAAPQRLAAVRVRRPIMGSCNENVSILFFIFRNLLRRERLPLVFMYHFGTQAVKMVHALQNALFMRVLSTTCHGNSIFYVPLWYISVVSIYV